MPGCVVEFYFNITLDGSCFCVKLDHCQCSIVSTQFILQQKSQNEKHVRERVPFSLFNATFQSSLVRHTMWCNRY